MVLHYSIINIGHRIEKIGIEFKLFVILTIRVLIEKGGLVRYLLILLFPLCYFLHNGITG